MYFHPNLPLSFGRRILSTPGPCHTREMKAYGGTSRINFALFPRDTVQGRGQNPGYDAGLWLGSATDWLRHLRRITFPFRTSAGTITFNACCKSTVSVPPLLKPRDRDRTPEKGIGLKPEVVRPAPSSAVRRAVTLDRLLSVLQCPACCPGSPYLALSPCPPGHF